MQSLLKRALLHPPGCPPGAADDFRRPSVAGRYSIAFSLLFAYLLLIYGNSFQASFQFDDWGDIANNDRIHIKEFSWENTADFFIREEGGLRLRRPLAYLSFALNYSFGGLEVTGYHLVNFAIHYLTGVFLFLLLYNTFQLPLLAPRQEKRAYSLALLALFFWAGHPLQLTAVTYLVQRMASMAALFSILAMYLYLKGRTAPNSGLGLRYFVGCWLAGLLALGSKENAAMLPVSLLLFELILIRQPGTAGLKKTLAYSVPALGLVACLGLLFIEPTAIAAGYQHRPFTMYERLLSAPRIFFYYISLLLYPLNSRLMLLHDFTLSTSLFSPWTTAPSLLALAVLIALALWSARIRPLLSFCFLFFLVNHLIEGSLIGLEPVFEHRNYLPSTFFFIPIALLILNSLEYFSPRRLLCILLFVLTSFQLAAQGHTTRMRNRIFQTEFSLWADNTAKAPALSRPHHNLGKIFWDHGFYRAAYREMQAAVLLNNYSNTSFLPASLENLGMYHLKFDNPAGAIEVLQRARTLLDEAVTPRILYGLGIAEYKQGNLRAAAGYIQQGLTTAPEDPDLLLAAGAIHLESGRLNEAMEAAGRARRLGAGFAKPLLILAEAARRSGRLEESAAYWHQYLEEKPANARGYFALLEIAGRLGDEEEFSDAMQGLRKLAGGADLVDLLHRVSQSGGDLDVYAPDQEILLPVLAEQEPDIDPETP